jgi:glycerophosphoryl diester phosphodiesterase
VRPIIIAHRGASGYRPEHTLAAYELAIEQGADFIEPDLVSTKDGVLVARHENNIEQTTDIAGHQEFASRRVTKIIDGRSITGWFTEDFTLAELKTLRARERLPRLRPHNAHYDGQFEIAKFEEILDLARRRRAGVYPETKHPSYFESLGLSLEEPLLAALRGFPFPVFIQSFESGNLGKLNEMTEHPLVQLLNPESSFDLHEVALYAKAIGPHKDLVIPRDASGRLTTATSLVRDAHELGLLVHPWTFRNEDEFLPADCRGNPAAEYQRFLATGIDGLFTDYPDTARASLR